jgi:hypothetical protein
MANPNAPNGFRVVQSGSSGPLVKYYPVAASQTIAAGDMVKLASGLVEIAGAADTALLGVARDPVATTASVTRADDVVAVYVADGDTIFEGQCSGSSTAALVGTTCDLEGTTGSQAVNENATSTNVLRVVGLRSDDDPSYDIGANDRALFTIEVSQFDGRS